MKLDVKGKYGGKSGRLLGEIGNLYQPIHSIDSSKKLSDLNQSYMNKKIIGREKERETERIR